MKVEVKSQGQTFYPKEVIERPWGTFYIVNVGEGYVWICVKKEQNRLIVSIDDKIPSVPKQVYLNNIQITQKEQIITLASTPAVASATTQTLTLTHKPWPKNIKRVTYASTFAVKCGIAVYLENLLSEMVKLSPETSFFVLAENKPELDDRNADSDVPNVAFERCFDRRASDYNDMLYEALSSNCDVFHVQHEWAYFPANDQRLLNVLKVLWKKGKFNVITYHSVPTFHSDEVEIHFQNYEPFTHANIVHSKRGAQMLRSFGVEDDKIRVIPMGAFTPVNMTMEEARQKILPPEDRKRTIISTGGFMQPSKGLKELINVSAELKKDFPDIMLLIAGGSHPWSQRLYDNYMKECIELARAHGVSLKWDYKFASDTYIDEILACGDIVVLNYYQASMSGISGFRGHALSCGRPAVVTDSILFDDLIDGVNCLKVPARNNEALKKAIEKLLSDQKLAERLAKSAREYAKEIHWSNCAKLHLNLYEELCDVAR
jgi:glycosyltransferase involved in cell wall biosynthesis